MPEYKYLHIRSINRNGVSCYRESPPLHIRFNIPDSKYEENAKVIAMLLEAAAGDNTLTIEALGFHIVSAKMDFVSNAKKVLTV